jgi:hypothetical protein
MTHSELLTFDEHLVLACILSSPRESAWELDGLAPDLFRPGPCRVVATVICYLRDRVGARFKYRHVVRRLRESGSRRQSDFARSLYWSVGTHLGMTESMSRLYRARELRSPSRLKKVGLKASEGAMP